MTVSFVGAASAEATSLTLPTHQAGDLIVMFAMRYGNAAAPTVPAGWNYRYLSHRNGLTTIISLALSFKVAASNAETSGTWTNGTHLLSAVYRDDANYLVLGCPNVRTGTGTLLTYNPKTASAMNANLNGTAGAMMAVATGYVLGLAAVHLNTAGIDTPPSGMTHRAMLTGATQGRLAIADTNAEVASFASATVTIAASADWLTNVVEIIDTGLTKTAAAGGLLLPRAMDGGYAS